MRFTLIFSTVAASGLMGSNEHIWGTNSMGRALKPRKSDKVCDSGQVKTYLKLTEPEQEAGAFGEAEK